MKTILFILFTMFYSIVSAQAPIWQWYKGFGGNGNDNVSNICHDSKGNIYIAGNFESQFLVFDNITLSNTNGGIVDNLRDVFITKINASGNVLWAKKVGGIFGDAVRNLSCDANNNIFLIGIYNSPSITFGDTTLYNSHTNVYGGYYNMFLAKYDTSGTVNLAKNIDLINANTCFNVHSTSKGSIFITGGFEDHSLTIDSFTLLNSDTINWNNDFFIAKLDASGNTIWAKSFGGSNYDDISSIIVDPNDNLFITGNMYSHTITFGNIVLINTSIEDTSDIFIAKLDSLGNTLWAKNAHGNSYDYSSSLCIDNIGNVYITGGFSSNVITFGNITLFNNGYTNIFITKYDSYGNTIWGKSIGNLYDFCSTITTDNNANLYITGCYNSPTISFGSTTLINTSNGQMSDFFLAQYDSSGNSIWAKSAFGTYNDEGSGICVDNYGNLYATGIYNYSMVINNDPLPIASRDNIFLVKISNTVTQILENNSKNDINIYPNPNNGKFSINNFNKQTIEKLEIFNLFGKKVYSLDFNNQHQEISDINISYLPKGIYIIKLYNDKNTNINKIIIQ